MFDKILEMNTKHCVVSEGEMERERGRVIVMYVVPIHNALYSSCIMTSSHWTTSTPQSYVCITPMCIMIQKSNGEKGERENNKKNINWRPIGRT